MSFELVKNVNIYIVLYNVAYLTSTLKNIFLKKEANL